MGNLKILAILMFATNFMLAQTKAEKKQMQFDKVKEMVSSGNFMFIADRAIGRAGTSISLAANRNYLKVQGDSTAAQMPFFGERFNSGNIGEPGAIEFETKMEGQMVEHNDKKGRTTIKFSARNEYDRFGVILEINRSGWANLLIRSIDRSTINYYGQVIPLEGQEISP